MRDPPGNGPRLRSVRPRPGPCPGLEFRRDPENKAGATEGDGSRNVRREAFLERGLGPAVRYRSGNSSSAAAASDRRIACECHLT